MGSQNEVHRLDGVWPNSRRFLCSTLMKTEITGISFINHSSIKHENKYISEQELCILLYGNLSVVRIRGLARTRDG